MPSSESVLEVDLGAAPAAPAVVVGRDEPEAGERFLPAFALAGAGAAPALLRVSMTAHPGLHLKDAQKTSVQRYCGTYDLLGKRELY